jgi:hypothetical protein
MHIRLKITASVCFTIRAFQNRHKASQKNVKQVNFFLCSLTPICGCKKKQSDHTFTVTSLSLVMYAKTEEIVTSF